MTNEPTAQVSATAPTQASALPSISPLAEAVPESLDDLFSKDPLQLTVSDRALIVASLREARVRWDLAEASGKRSAPKLKATPKAAADPKINLEDLGL